MGTVCFVCICSIARIYTLKVSVSRLDKVFVMDIEVETVFFVVFNGAGVTCWRSADNLKQVKIGTYLQSREPTLEHS